MKNIIIILMLIILGCLGCQKETPEKKDEWVEIDSIFVISVISEKLDSIFADSWNMNECLKIDYKTILYSVNSLEEYEKIDTCNTIPVLDFGNYTLTIGGFGVPYYHYKISNINLYANEAKESYNYEILVDTCEYCYSVAGYKYFWRLYPKLNSDYQLNVLVKKSNRL